MVAEHMARGDIEQSSDMSPIILGQWAFKFTESSLNDND